MSCHKPAFLGSSQAGLGSGAIAREAVDRGLGPHTALRRGRRQLEDGAVSAGNASGRAIEIARLIKNQVAVWVTVIPAASEALNAGLHLLKRRLVESHTTVIIPFDDRVSFVSLLHCAEFSRRLSEVTQTLDAISGIQFLVSGKGFAERRLLGAV